MKKSSLQPPPTQAKNPKLGINPPITKEQKSSRKFAKQLKTAKPAPIDVDIKKQFQLPATTSSNHDIDLHGVPSEHTLQVNLESCILENSNTKEVGNLNYVVIGNLEIAAILEFPLAAFLTIQYLVQQLRLSISDNTIKIVLEAKQILLSSVLSNDTCMIAVPLPTSIFSTNIYSFIRTTAEQRHATQISCLNQKVQFHATSLVNNIDALILPRLLLSFRRIPMEFSNYVCSKLLSLFNTHEFPVQVILLNHHNIYAGHHSRISKEPFALVIVPSTSATILIDRFYEKFSSQTTITFSYVATGIHQTNIVPGLQLECSIQLSTFLGQKFLESSQSFIVELKNISLEFPVPTTTSAIINIVPRDQIISVLSSCMIRDFSTYYIIANSNIDPIDVAKMQSLAVIGGKVHVSFTNHIPPSFAAKFAIKTFRRNTSKAASSLDDDPTAPMSTDDPITIESPPSRLEDIMALLLDVQQRLKVIEKYLVPPSRTSSPPRKTSNNKIELNSAMFNPPYTQASSPMLVPQTSKSSRTVQSGSSLVNHLSTHTPPPISKSF